MLVLGACWLHGAISSSNKDDDQSRDNILWCWKNFRQRSSVSNHLAPLLPQWSYSNFEVSLGKQNMKYLTPLLPQSWPTLALPSPQCNTVYKQQLFAILAISGSSPASFSRSSPALISGRSPAPFSGSSPALMCSTRLNLSWSLCSQVWGTRRWWIIIT